MKMPDDYQVPDDPDSGKMDASYLRTCLGLRSKPGETPPELPRAVKQAYFDMARSLSLLGAMGRGMDATQLATVVALAIRDGVSVMEPKPKSPAFEGAEDGQKVVIHYRNADRGAHFLRMEGDRVIVLHHGIERKIRPDLVRLAEDHEFPDVAENINQEV